MIVQKVGFHIRIHVQYFLHIGGLIRDMVPVFIRMRCLIGNISIGIQITMPLLQMGGSQGTDTGRIQTAA